MVENFCAMCKNLGRGACMHLHAVQCCGVREFHGLDLLKTVEDVLNIRRSVVGGLVFFTVTYERKRVTPLLRGGGARRVAKFRNPNTANIVEMWVAERLWDKTPEWQQPCTCTKRGCPDPRGHCWIDP